MSFLNDIIDIGSSALNWFTGSSPAAGLARSAALGFALNQVQSSVNKENDAAKPSTAPEKDYGVREQVDPDTEYSVPVVYGNAFLSGSVTDAVLTDGNTTMWYCITVCEETGLLMSNSADSILSFESIYWNGNRVGLQADGITAATLTDDDGNVSTDISGLVKFYPFNNGSITPTKFTNYVNGNGYNAYDIFPNWTTSHTMNGLVFCLVKVTYNKEKEITGLGNLEFNIKNTMKMPGDCLYDYMTNTRYGAGITPEEIYQS